MFLTTLLLLVRPSPAQAQSGTSRIGLLVINAAIGGATAAITASVHHRPIRKAAAIGVIGGATVFAGKCFIGNSRPATDWLGHQTVSVGSSLVSNAAMGRSTFERIVLPFGPVRLYYDTKRGRARIKLDLLETGVASYYATTPNTSVDWHLSLKHGTLILFDKTAPTNFEVAGVIKTWSRSASLLDHEQVHVAQEQFVTTAWEEPLEGRLLPMLPGGRWVHKYFEIGILAPVWALANASLSRSSRPWEKEATAVEHRC